LFEKSSGTIYLKAFGIFTEIFDGFFILFLNEIWLEK